MKATPWEPRPRPETGHGTVYALGIDIGSTNTKVALASINTASINPVSINTVAVNPVATGPAAVDHSGTVTELVVRSSPTPGDVPDLLRAVEDGIRAVLDAADVTPRVIGIASMAETGVPLDADGVALTGLIRWNSGPGSSARDPRDVATLVDRFGAPGLFAATGVPPRPKAPLATWLWLRRTRPDSWRRMERWAGAADLVCLALTGRLATDHTLAGRSMAYRLPRFADELPREFDATLLDAVGLEPAQLPEVTRPGEIAGTVTAGAGIRTGLTAGTPVIVAGHDHAVGAWACGVRRAGDVADSIGTAEALLRVLPGPADRRAVAASGMSLTRTVTGETESLLAGTGNAGSLIGWWFENLLDRADPDVVFAEVDALPPGPGGLLVLPYLSGRQAPSPDPSARLRILDAAGSPVDPASRSPARLSRAEFSDAEFSRAELTRGLLEGLCLQLRWMDAEQCRLAGGDPGDAGSGAIAVLGGAGAANRTWLRVKAEVMPAALERVTVTEPVASGAALLAAVRLGLVAEDASLPRAPVSTDGAAHGGTTDGGTRAGTRYAAAYEAFVAAATKTTRSEGTE